MLRWSRMDTQMANNLNFQSIQLRNPIKIISVSSGFGYFNNSSNLGNKSTVLPGGL